MGKDVRKRAARKKKEDAPALTYWRETRLPVYSLAFVLPMVLFYEVAIILVNRHLSANYNAVEALIHRVMVRVFVWMGLPAVAVSGLLVAAVLVAWQVVSRRPWEVKLGTLCGMLAESSVLAVALPLMVCYALEPLLSAAGAQAAPSFLASPLFAKIVLFFGAGVYEEFVFRLLLVPALAFVVCVVAGVGWRAGVVCGIVLSAVAFAAAHYVGELAQVFEWPGFLFHVVSGLFFGAVYYFRGFGIAAGSHALYDVVYLVLFQGRGAAA